MAKKKRTVVTAESLDREALVNALESQGNAIPPAIAVIVRLVAPILTRIAIRYVARVARKRISDATVNSASRHVSSIIKGIIERAAEDSKEKPP